MSSNATTLPSGKTYTVRPGKGRDLLAAQRAAKSPDEIPYALIAQLVEIDGKPVVYEDVLEMDLPDVLALQQAVMGEGNFQQPAGTSSTSAQ